jgi:beta-lactamase superfamily II metal-dependent hydrolase
MHRRLREALQTEGIETRPAVAGLKIACDGKVDAEVIFPPAGFSAAAADNQALVVQLHTASARVLLMSDSGETTERALIASGRDLRSDIIVKGQNRSGASGIEEFLNAVQPKLIVATSRPFPPVEAIDPQWVEKVRQRGIRLFRQDETGAVEFGFSPNEWEARAYFTGETFRSVSR